MILDDPNWEPPSSSLIRRTDNPNPLVPFTQVVDGKGGFNTGAAIAAGAALLSGSVLLIVLVVLIVLFILCASLAVTLYCCNKSKKQAGMAAS